MALIATINNKPVYSDKQMATVVNTRVTFTDGSWCDVNTGEVHSVGSGYINIGGTDTGSDAKKVTEGPKRFSASALKVSGIVADVRVGTHQGSDIECTITGPADQVEAIRANVKGDTLVIEGNGSGSSGGVRIAGGNVTIQARGRIVVSGGRGVVIGDNTTMTNDFSGGRSTTIITESNSGESAVQVTVKVPQGAPVDANHVLGKVVIGDTDGPLTACVQGNDVYAGRVTDAQLTVQGSGKINVNEVNGAVTAQIQGSGNIVIEHGSMPSLTATVQGSGNVKVDGSATTANLTIMGSGNISVAHVQQPPMEKVMGSGKIRVQRVG